VATENFRSRHHWFSLAQLAVAAIAERAVLRMLAAAPRHGFVHGDVHFLRREGGAFVRAVAERLAFGFAAGAPVEAAGRGFQNAGKFLGNRWFAHAFFVAVPPVLAT
jgi:hypothetical protein